MYLQVSQSIVTLVDEYILLLKMLQFSRLLEYARWLGIRCTFRLIDNFTEWKETLTVKECKHFSMPRNTYCKRMWWKKFACVENVTSDWNFCSYKYVRRPGYAICETPNFFQDIRSTLVSSYRKENIERLSSLRLLFQRRYELNLFFRRLEVNRDIAIDFNINRTRRA